MNLASVVKDLSLYTNDSDGTETAKHLVVAAVEQLHSEITKESADKAAVQVSTNTTERKTVIQRLRKRKRHRKQLDSAHFCGTIHI